MRALVMAAGLGTRLKPLTDTLPKPLVPLAGRPMVIFVLEHLAREGITEAILNIHYLPEKMRAFVNAWNAKKLVPHLTIQDETAKILGSGGAVALAAPWLFEKDDFALVCNADVLAAPSLRLLAEAHRKVRGQGIECTLTVMNHPEAGKKYSGLVVKDQRVLSFEPAGSKAAGLMHFPGFYIVDVLARRRLVPGKEFSIVENFWKPLAMEGKLGAFTYDGHYQDLGTLEDLKMAELLLMDH